MTVERLHNAHRASPFRPFTIRLADGRSFLVRHPDFLSRSPSGRTIIVHGENESYSVLDLLLRGSDVVGGRRELRRHRLVLTRACVLLVRQRQRLQLLLRRRQVRGQLRGTRAGHVAVGVRRARAVPKFVPRYAA